MSKNIFICHRPYHILRSCDIIRRKYEVDSENFLIVYDVKLAGHQTYQRFKTNDIFYSYFDKIVEVGRCQSPSIKQPWKFLKYCSLKRKEYFNIVNKFKDIDSLYFFSDDELDIQILLNLFLSKSKKDIKRVLVDEGVATYSNLPSASWKMKCYSVFLSKLAGFRYYNYNYTYGGSHFYNYSLANDPEKAVFRGAIEKLPVVSEDLCKELRRKISVNFPTDRPYFLYVSTYLVSLEIEIAIIKEIRDCLNRHGISMFIKLHPLQNEELYSDFSNILLDKGYPIELFYSRQAIIGGGISSSIYNGYLAGCNVVNMSPLFNQQVEGIAVYSSIASADSIESFERLILNCVNRL